MQNNYDVIVIGLGAHGSATVYELSKTNHSVLGIDRFSPPHAHGSSHGESRIIRQAYHEHPMYVPLVRKAYELWQNLEAATDRDLLLNTGGLILGREDSEIVKGTILSAETHKLPFEKLTSHEIRKHFPAINPASDTVAVLDKTAGILYPEKCIHAFLKKANDNGATLRYNERVLRIDANSDILKVETDAGIYYAGKLIVSAGAWLNSLLPDLHLPLRIERQVLHWFKDENQNDFFAPHKLPIYIWEYEKGKAFYGFPDLGTGMKAALHYGGETIKPDQLCNDVSGDEIGKMKAVITKFFNVSPTHQYSTTCMYTNTPDEQFIIDHHPSIPNIIIASPCSGHGFKFASVIGKILMQLATSERVDFDLSPFRIQRFKN